jgi:ATP-dependent RNA helicase RhlE
MAALEAFKQGSVEVLVATDVAARGLDIAELPCVINYDLPYNAEDYVHRIGRTGRAGASGDAISLFSDKDARLLQDIEKLIKHKIARLDLAGFDPGRAAERRPRYEESSERERSPSSNRGNYGRSAHAPRKEKVDPWFLKPYEPAAPSGGTEAENNGENNASPAAKPKVKVAALLGGVPKR